MIPRLVALASKRRVRRQACSRKKGYENREHAERDIELLRQRGNMHPMNAYRCAFCGLWHVGHLKLTSKRRRLD